MEILWYVCVGLVSGSITLLAMWLAGRQGKEENRQLRRELAAAKVEIKQARQVLDICVLDTGMKSRNPHIDWDALQNWSDNL